MNSVNDKRIIKNLNWIAYDHEDQIRKENRNQEVSRRVFIDVETLYDTLIDWTCVKIQSLVTALF